MRLLAQSITSCKAQQKLFIHQALLCCPRSAASLCVSPARLRKKYGGFVCAGFSLQATSSTGLVYILCCELPGAGNVLTGFIYTMGLLLCGFKETWTVFRHWIAELRLGGKLKHEWQKGRATAEKQVRMERERESINHRSTFISAPANISVFSVESSGLGRDTIKYGSLRVTNAKFPSPSPVLGWRKHSSRIPVLKWTLVWDLSRRND